MSFLHRLADLPPEPLLASIARNLCVVLNTRKGCGSVVPGFGLGDYESHPNTIEAVGALAGEIASLVRRYEPRLASPEVRLLGREGTSRVCFALSGAVSGRSVVFHVAIHSEYRNVIVSLA